MRVKGIRAAARRPRRALVSLGVLGVVGIILTACGPGAGGGSVHTTASLKKSAPAASPKVFAAFEGFHLEIRSAVTGRLIRTLHAGGNVIDPSRAGRYVYYTAQRGNQPWPIERVAITGGAPTEIGTGWDPVISPNGKELAFVSVHQDDTLVVENLATRSLHRLDLRALIGSDATLGGLTWLGNDRLAAIPPPDGVAVSYTSSSRSVSAGKTTTCTSLITKKRQCVLVVDSPSTARHAQLDVLPRSVESYAIVSTAGPSAHTLLIGATGTVSRLTVGANRITVEHTYTVPGDESLAFCFSPNGRELLYLRNHGPVQLWTGTIGRTTIRPLRELQPNVDFGSAAW